MISFSTLKYAAFFSRLAAFKIRYNTFLTSSTSLGKSSDTPNPAPLGKIFDVRFDEKFILKIRQPNYNQSRSKTSAI